jgi:hypothetical protein
LKSILLIIFLTAVMAAGVHAQANSMKQIPGEVGINALASIFITGSILQGV